MVPILLRGLTGFPTPIWEEQLSLNHRIYFIASLCICFLQTVPWQHPESSCQLHPGQPLPLKTWSYESLTSQQSLAHYRMEQEWGSTPVYSPTEHCLSPSLLKTNTLVLICEDFFIGDLQERVIIIHTRLIVTTFIWALYSYHSTEYLAWMVLFNWYRCIGQVLQWPSAYNRGVQAWRDPISSLTSHILQLVSGLSICISNYHVTLDSQGKVHFPHSLRHGSFLPKLLHVQCPPIFLWKIIPTFNTKAISPYICICFLKLPPKWVLGAWISYRCPGKEKGCSLTSRHCERGL